MNKGEPEASAGRRKGFSNCTGIPEVGYCTVRPSGSSLWGLGGPAQDIFLEPHHVQCELNRKNPKYLKYLESTKDLKEVWLLVFNEGPLSSVPSCLGDAARDSMYVYPFDRVYWFDLFPADAGREGLVCLRKREG